MHSYYSKRKKQRGQKRKLKNMLQHMKKFTINWETTEIYQHFHVPSDPFIEHPRTSDKIKHQFYEAWLTTAAVMLKEKPKDIPFCKITALFTVPELWGSEIIVFFDKEYYDSFFLRNDEYQTWLPIKHRSFLKEHNLLNSYKEIGFTQIIKDEGTRFENELWFYGDIPDVL